VSAYHTFFSEDHGTETRPTYYFGADRKDNSTSITYFYLAAGCSALLMFESECSPAGKGASDHMPLWVDVADSGA
jgi:hypothetical protein